MLFLKNWIRQYFPFLVKGWRRLQTARKLAGKPLDSTFTQIYRANSWSDRESVSGPGSRLNRTDKIRLAFPGLLAHLDCKTMLDIPCGDFNWMKLVDLAGIHYTGADIVPDLIAANQTQYQTDQRQFRVLDLTQDALPCVDLIFCRDCLVHLSYAHIFQALANIKKSGSAYFLVTHFAERGQNNDIFTGEWRAINFQKPPFNFPEPIRLLDDRYDGPNYYDKFLGLWKIGDLPELPQR